MGALTDFNDLHVTAGLPAVREQILRALQQPPAMSLVVANEEGASPPPPSLPEGATSSWSLDKVLQRFALIFGDTKVFDLQRQQTIKSRAFADLVTDKVAKEWKAHPERKTVTPEDLERLLAAKGGKGEDRTTIDRYVLLHGTASAWDMADRKIMTKPALQMALGDSYKIWENSPGRRIIPAENLVFDPTLRVSPETHINTFTGLPLKPSDDFTKAQPIIDLLWWVCNGDSDIFNWVVKWLALPLQQVGAKMFSALLVHGVQQGAGKSLFFCDVHRKLYGQDYGSVVGQHQLDSIYSDWKSRMLWAVFEEIFSNATKYNHMGTVKHMVTGATQRIEKKFVSGWEESNHMNVAFLSNELQPLPIEPQDRRMLVIWPEYKLDKTIASAVEQAIGSGGLEAWYGYMLSQSLGDFRRDTEPIMTAAKERLIEYGLPGWQTFYREWKAGRLAVPYATCKADQLYRAYTAWCSDAGEKTVLSRAKFCSNMKGLQRHRADLWYLDCTTRRQATFFLEGEPPADQKQERWLGDCADAFERELGRR